MKLKASCAPGSGRGTGREGAAAGLEVRWRFFACSCGALRGRVSDRRCVRAHSLAWWITTHNGALGLEHFIAKLCTAAQLALTGNEQQAGSSITWLRLALDERAASIMGPSRVYWWAGERVSGEAWLRSQSRVRPCCRNTFSRRVQADFFLMEKFQKFLTLLSVRPGSSWAILAQQLPYSCRHSAGGGGVDTKMWRAKAVRRCDRREPGGAHRLGADDDGHLPLGEAGLVNSRVQLIAPPQAAGLAAPPLALLRGHLPGQGGPASGPLCLQHTAATRWGPLPPNSCALHRAAQPALLSATASAGAARMIAAQGRPHLDQASQNHVLVTAPGPLERLRVVTGLHRPLIHAQEGLALQNCLLEPGLEQAEHER